MDDCICSLLAFTLAFSSLNRDNCAVVVGVADDDCAVLYPRKGGENGGLRGMIHDGSDLGAKIDPRKLHDDFKKGVAELCGRAAAKAERAAAAAAASSGADAEGGDRPPPPPPPREGSALASGISLALCVVNRFMVAAHGGVSALSSDSALTRGDDGGGVLAMLEATNAGKGEKGSGKRARKAAEEKEERRRVRGMLTPRVLVVQATDDRTGDYNALMNCSFACQKSDVAVDGCYIPSGLKGRPKTSPYLEQMCDRTGGVFLTPSGAAQVGGALTEVMTSVFLPPLAARRFLNLPSLTKVDFRARCFETGESVDIAHVCNQCLSIFKNRPRDFCPTCGAEVKLGSGGGADNSGGIIGGGGGEDMRSPKRLKRA